MRAELQKWEDAVATELDECLDMGKGDICWQHFLNVNDPTDRLKHIVTQVLIEYLDKRGVRWSAAHSDA